MFGDVVNLNRRGGFLTRPGRLKTVPYKHCRSSNLFYTPSAHIGTAPNGWGSNETATRSMAKSSAYPGQTTSMLWQVLIPTLAGIVTCHTVIPPKISNHYNFDGKCRQNARFFCAYFSITRCLSTKPFFRSCSGFVVNAG